MNSINDIWKEISDVSAKYEKSINSLLRKQTGSYYTNLDLAYLMVKELVNSFNEDELLNIDKKTFLEPCVGTGNFVFAYLRVCSELNISNTKIENIINNIYVCDINNEALLVYKNNMIKFANVVFGITIQDCYFEDHIGHGLLFDVNSNEIEYIGINQIFPKISQNGGFDIVVTNPPYKNLKAESSHYVSKEEQDKDKNKYERIAKLSKLHFKYSTKGTLNLYKLFVEDILEKYSKKDSYCSLLIPSSILSDKSCTDLRTMILDNHKIISIKMIAENSEVVDASQALAAILIKKNNPTDSILINGGLGKKERKDEIANINDIVDSTTGNSILILSARDNFIRSKMKQYPLLKNINGITNLRGELDITFNKSSIVEQPTSYKFYRGRNIGFYKTITTEPLEYVIDEFVEKTTKKKYISTKRLACQQIANMSKRKRIAFTIVNENSVLGNSCNFIAVSDDIDIYFLLGILNSELIEWYFNLTSSNNHVNNYEIDNFPIPIGCSNAQVISDLVVNYINTFDSSILVLIEREVRNAYGIKEEN